MARIGRVLLVVVLAGCSADGSVTSTVATTSPPSGVTTTVGATTTVATTLPPPPTTTTTTLPRLDRSDGLTIARMRSDLDVLLADGPRVSGSPAEAAAIAHFVAVAEEITGSEPTLQTVPLPEGAVSANASIEVGTGERWLVLGAHIDSVSGAPGADDNGSGVVLLLELLRRLVENPPEGLRVTVVAFGAEERIGQHGHHFGSRHAVAEMPSLPDFMVSVDMVGIGAELQVVDHRDSDGAFADELALVAGDAGIAVVRNSRGEVSDHVPFARAGVPAALLNRPDNPGYHSPQDDVVFDDALLTVLDLLEAIVAHLTPEAHEIHGGDEQHV
jgi:hypothetical protein